MPDDPIGIHYGLYEDGQLISVISTFAQEQEIQFRKFAIAKECQGRGYGAKLLHYVIAAATPVVQVPFGVMPEKTKFLSTKSSA